MEGSKIKITNYDQFEHMVRLMEANVELAKGYFRFGSSRADYSEAWNNIAKQLNSLGPPIREAVGWQRVWNVFKMKIRKKLRYNNEIYTTGGCSNKIYIFPPLEESVISILCQEETYSASRCFELPTNNETSSSNTVGSYQQHSAINNNNNNPYELPIAAQNNVPIGITTPITLNDPHQHAEETELNPVALPRGYRKRSFSTNDQEERRKLVKSQANNIEEQTKYLKECARYARKSFAIQEKKLTMWQENEIEKRKISQQNLEFKLKCLEYKEKKLAFQETYDKYKHVHYNFYIVENT